MLLCSLCIIYLVGRTVVMATYFTLQDVLVTLRNTLSQMSVYLCSFQFMSVMQLWLIEIHKQVSERGGKDTNKNYIAYQRSSGIVHEVWLKCKTPVPVPLSHFGEYGVRPYFPWPSTNESVTWSVSPLAGLPFQISLVLFFFFSLKVGQPLGLFRSVP